MKKTKKRGPRKTFAELVQKAILLTPEHDLQLKDMAEYGNISESEVIRRLIDMHQIDLRYIPSK